MAYDDATFRAQFPEFSDTTKYPMVLISMYYDMACEFIDSTDSPCRSLNGGALALALNYMTAHLMALGIAATNSMVNSGTPEQGGFVQSASIDKISVAKQALPATGAWGYFLGQTSYGQSLWALLAVRGVGGLSVGGNAEGDSFRRAYGVFGNLGNGGVF